MERILICTSRRTRCRPVASGQRRTQRAKAGAHQRASTIRLRDLGQGLKKDYAAAISTYRQALKLRCKMSARERDLAAVLKDLGEAERMPGDLAAAERDHQEAWHIGVSIGDNEIVASETGYSAGLAVDRKDWSGAEILAREALLLSERVGRLDFIASNCDRLAKALSQQGKKAEGLPHARRAVEVYTKLGSPNLQNALSTLRACES